jgi:hypothetical protein
VLVACAHSYPLVFAAARIRVLRDMVAKFGEMGPKPPPPARPPIRDAEPEKMLRRRRSYCGTPDYRKADDRVLFAAQPMNRS